MAKTKEQLQTEADAEIESAKPMYKQVNNERMEFEESDYAQAKIDLGNSKWEAQQFGYIQARQESYHALSEQFDMLFWAIDSGSFDKKSDFCKELKQDRDDKPKPT